MTGEAGSHGSSRASIVLTLAIVATQAVLLGILTAVSGSSTLFAETMFSVSDVGVEVLLLVGLYRSRRPADEEHPLGYGGEAFYWSLLAAVGLFVGGGVAGLLQGLASLGHPEPGQGYLFAYLLLFALLLTDGVALVGAVRMLRGRARSAGRGLAAEFSETTDPAAQTVFAANAAAVATAPVAVAGLALHQATGNGVFDSVASILIGLMLIALALVLMRTDRYLMSAPSAGDEARERIGKLVAAVEGVAGVARVTALITGPEQAVVAVRAVFDPGLDRAGVAAAIRRVERMLDARPGIVDAYVTPVSASDAAAGEAAR
ncbi:cation diffusion facilitator family transporter [Streptomyces sp. NPDC047017]|uniref:cation diffusion facilitator family transporter n=1 Tax=Streptomyces sp. NPDC047017 TaxID=3155024 RepID=UPI0033E29B89